MKLIDKDALVAEINQRVEDYKLHKIYDSYHDGLIFALEDLRDDFINTLEVKKADLEKHLKEDIEDVLFDLDGVAVKGATHYLTVEDVKDIAKYFFELGMQVSSKAQKGEEYGKRI